MIRKSLTSEQAYQAAISLHQQGRIEEATELYRAVLTLDSDHFEALNNLGILRAKQGFATEAERLLRRAVKCRPQSAEAHHNLAQALRALQRMDEAAAHADEAELWRSVQSAAARADWPQCERLYRAMLERHPRHLQTLSNLGFLYIRMGRFDEAAGLFQKAVAERPNFVEVHNALGMALRHLKRFDEAVAHFRRAIALRPDYAEAHANLGNALVNLNRFDEAAASLRRAVKHKPGFALAHRDLGSVLQTLGQLEAARDAVETAIRLEPRQSSLYRSLGELKRFAAEDPHLAAMEALASDLSALPEDQQIELHFALGKAYADIGRHEQSFGQLLEGNRLARRRIVYDERAMLELFGRMQTVFDADLMRAKAQLGDVTDTPIFIVGMPRSGTTLVEQILACHPMVMAGGELEEFTRAIQTMHGSREARYPEVVPSLSAEELRAIGAQYGNAIAVKASGRRRDPKKTRITDKLPANFLHAGLIPLALPNARIIHVRRNPLDTCLSCFSILFLSGQLPYTYDLTELGRYYRAYAVLMEHWRRVLRPGVMLEVDYEEVVADLDGQARRMIAHCGLPWDDACRDFHRAERPVWTASSRQVRQPVYRSSVGRSAPYRHLLGPLLAAIDGKA